MAQNSTKNDSGSGGCLTLILGIITIWALLFGVTVGGKHYGLSGCDTDHGVKIDRGAP